VQAESRFLLWLSSVLILGVGILLGMIFAKLTGKKDDVHRQELEEQLEQSRKEIEQYRTQVNEYFMKTSELVDQMTASYRAIFMHLANGAQALSGLPHDASLKLPENDFFAHPLPPDRSTEDGEFMSEAGKEEVAVGAGDEIEPEQPGQTPTGDAEEKTLQRAPTGQADTKEEST